MKFFLFGFVSVLALKTNETSNVTAKPAILLANSTVPSKAAMPGNGTLLKADNSTVTVSPKVVKLPKPTNSSTVEPPKVLYATPAILAIYGIEDTIETQAPVRLSDSQYKLLKSKYDQLYKSNSHLSVAAFAKFVWKNLEDKDQVAYAKWYFAHTLNLYIAMEAVLPAAVNISGDAYRIIMGQCVCNRGYLFRKLSEFCSEKPCYVDNKQAERAVRVLETSAATVRFWNEFISVATSENVPISAYDAKWFVDEANLSLKHAVQMNPDLGAVVEGYTQLLKMSFLSGEIPTIESSKKEGRKHKKSSSEE